ncbi:outer membrane protein [Cognatiyoonia sp. IB215446]|uniref:outer membrane protein n=1 Tax=Cognatiyoonia sp. IB215446 TaxID=3097355 RepID=UPI0039B77B63
MGYGYAESPFRAELEFAYRTAEADGAAGTTGDFASTTLALNGYYDFKPVAGGRLTPFVEAGLAYVTEIDFDISGTRRNRGAGVFGYQLMAAAAYPVSDRCSISGELRYFDAGSQSLSGPGGTLSADYRSVDIALGTAFRF